LDSAFNKAVEEHERIMRTLNEYENIGMGFDKLVAEYASILQDIQDKKWAMEEIQRDSTNIIEDNDFSKFIEDDNVEL
jgi:hypothetical protein